MSMNRMTKYYKKRKTAARSGNIRAGSPSLRIGVNDFANLNNILTNNTGPDIGIELTGNIILTGPLTIRTGKTVTISSTGGRKTLTRAANFSGDMFTIMSGAKLIINNVIIDGNKNGVTGSPGAIIVLAGVDSALDVGNNTILRNNKNETTNGGAISANGGQVRLLYGSEISGNTAAYGGGVALMGSTTLIQENGGTINNNAAAIDGGGIAGILWSGTINIRGNISFNAAAKNGGGIYVPKGSLSRLTVESSAIFSQNTATNPVMMYKASDHALYTSRIFGIVWSAYNQGYNNLDIAYSRAASGSGGTARRQSVWIGGSHPVVLCDRPYSSPINVPCGCRTMNGGGRCCNVSFPTC
ncbi:MAG: hypothetical protein LBS11_12300 [Oscillospiraceae bacterium]|jgi:hypothetical protein|nr:hypothetical protein [Oscillospiraceae bacterium]